MSKKIKQEVEFILDNLGSLSLVSIASKLGKSVNTVQKNLYTYVGSANTKKLTGLITAGELARMFQIDRNIVMGWIERNGLPSTEKVTNRQRRFTFIDVVKFWKWAEENKKRIDFSKLEKHSLPPEPHWVEAQRTIKKSTNYKAWTVQEENRLMSLVKQGKSFVEISKIFNRPSVAAVEKKYYRIKNSYHKIN